MNMENEIMVEEEIPPEPRHLLWAKDSSKYVKHPCKVPAMVMMSVFGGLCGVPSDTDPIFFVDSSIMRKLISDEFHIRPVTIKKYIQRMIQSNYLVKTDMQDVYACNAWIVIPSDFVGSIDELRERFTEKDGEWVYKSPKETRLR